MAKIVGRCMPNSIQMVTRIGRNLTHLHFQPPFLLVNILTLQGKMTSLEEWAQQAGDVVLQ